MSNNTARLFLLGLPSSQRQINLLGGRSFRNGLPHPSMSPLAQRETQYSCPTLETQTSLSKHLLRLPAEADAANPPGYVLNANLYSPHLSPNSRQCLSHSPKNSISTPCSGSLVMLDAEYKQFSNIQPRRHQGRWQC